MGRTKEKVDPERGNRLRLWIKKIGLKNKECAALIPMTEEAFSNVLKSGKLTYENACIISDKTIQHTEDGTPYQVRVDYLMNRDNFMTTLDYKKHIATEKYFQNRGLDMQECASDLVQSALRNIAVDLCEQKEIAKDKIINLFMENNFPELPGDDKKVITALVVDYAYSLVFNRLNNETNQPLWLYVRGQRLKEL